MLLSILSIYGIRCTRVSIDGIDQSGSMPFSMSDHPVDVMQRGTAGATLEGEVSHCACFEQPPAA